MSQKGSTYDPPIEILKYNKKFFKKLYLWPSENCILWWLIPVYMTLPPMLTDLIVTLMKPHFLFTEIAETIVEILTLVIATYVYIAYNYIQPHFLNIYQRLMQLQKYHLGDHEFLIVAERQTKLLTTSLLAFTMLVCHPLFTSIPLLTYKECKQEVDEILQHNFTRYLDIPVCGLELKGRFPYNINHHFWPWLIIEIVQIFGGMATSSVPATCSLLLVEIVIYLLFEINNLKKFLIHICDTTDDVREMTKRLKHSLKYHMEIIEISELINEAFGLVFMTHFLLLGVGISLLTLNIATDKTELKRLSMELNAWVFVLFIPSHYGQQLISESEDIARAVYETAWYEAPVKIRKDILMIMIRSQKSLKFQTKSVGIFCYASFVAIMKSSYSLFNLVMSSQNSSQNK